jgi:hypothetical protein
MFFASSLVMGFMSPAGVHYAANPLLNHIFGGSLLSLVALGLGGIGYVVWHISFIDSLRCLGNFRGGWSGKSKDDFFAAVLVVLVVIGLCVVLWYVLKAIYRMVCEARHELVGAIRGANERSKRELAKDYIVLDFTGDV